MQLAPSEKRKSERKQRSGALAWRYLGRDNAEVGWLLESSDDGLAFAWRGDTPPKVGALVELLEDTAGGAGESDRAVVRRSSSCHDNLNVIALELLRNRPFPPRVEEAKIEQEDLTPQIRRLQSWAAA